MLNIIKTAKINKKAQKGGKDYEQKGVKTRESASILALGAGAAVVSKKEQKGMSRGR